MTCHSARRFESLLLLWESIPRTDIFLIFFNPQLSLMFFMSCCLVSFSCFCIFLFFSRQTTFQPSQVPHNGRKVKTHILDRRVEEEHFLGLKDVKVEIFYAKMPQRWKWKRKKVLFWLKWEKQAAPQGSSAFLLMLCELLNSWRFCKMCVHSLETRQCVDKSDKEVFAF
jgi:hypothetical protein